jgi:hypothetical protein
MLSLTDLLLHLKALQERADIKLQGHLFEVTEEVTLPSR